MKSTDKERLEEIEKRMYHEGYDINPASVEPNQFDDDVAWLIAKVRKQAERAQELDKELTVENELHIKADEDADRLDAQNKHYREAFEHCKYILEENKQMNKNNDSIYILGLQEGLEFAIDEFEKALESEST